MREPHGKLRQPPPQLPLVLGPRLPRILEHFMRMEGLTAVQQLLRLGDALLRGAYDAHGLPGDPVRAVRQRPPEPVPRPGIPGPPLTVPVPRPGHPARRRAAPASRTAHTPDCPA